MSKQKFLPVEKLEEVIEYLEYVYIYEINMILDSEGKTADDLMEPRDIYRFRGQEEMIGSATLSINDTIEKYAIELESEDN